MEKHEGINFFIRGSEPGTSLVSFQDEYVGIDEIIDTIAEAGHSVLGVEYVGSSFVIDAGGDLTVHEGDRLTLDGSRSSQPVDELFTYEWVQKEGTMVTLSDSESLQPAFTAPDVSSDGEFLVFELVYVSSSGTEHTDSVTVNVLDTPRKVHTELTSLEAKNMIDANPDIIILDVREENEFCNDDGGHIPSAVNYPWNSGVLQEKYDELPFDADIFIICRSGNRSHQAGNFLDSLGFESVYDIGGMNTWEWEAELCVAGIPVSISVTASETEGTAPLNVEFSAIAADGVEPYMFEWDFGDGSVADGSNISRSFTVAGSYTVRVDVTDSSGDTASQSVDVFVSEPETSQPATEVPDSDISENHDPAEAGDSNTSDDDGGGGGCFIDSVRK